MKLNKQQKLVLYALGLSYKHFHNNFKEKAIYKNLEFLEQKKIVSYKNKSLALSQRGNKLFENLNKEVSPFLNLTETFNSQNILNFTKKARTVLSAKDF